MSSFPRRVVRRLLSNRRLALRRIDANNGTPLPLLQILTEHYRQKNICDAVIQIGANDGLMADPIHSIVVELGLPALFVEPLPDLFEKLKKSYEGVDNLAFENVAVGLDSGTLPLYRVTNPPADYPDWATGIATFDKHVLLSHQHSLPDLSRHISEIQVPVLTFTELMTRQPEFNAPLLLQVDTEGFDFVVIKSLLNANVFPRIINYEHKHLSLSDQQSCRKLLSEFDYEFASYSSEDTIAVRSPTQRQSTT